MSGSSQQARLVRFGLYEADFAARELRRDGAKVKLQDRPFEVLTILLERPGEVVSREDLRKRLWPADTFVDFDPSLNTSINKLRQALSDDAENPRFIATAGRRGYRFIAPVTVVNGAQPPQVMPAVAAIEAPVIVTNVPARYGTWMGVALGVSALAIAAVLAATRLIPERTPKVLNVVQISHAGHLDPWGRITTDGARFFFIDRAGGHWNLMQVPASGGEARPFPEPSQNTKIVDISPDRSEFLTFAFTARSTDLPLSLTPVVGGPSRRVGNIVADDAAFFPDGRRIVYDRPDGIYSCQRDGSSIQRIVALPGRSEDPRWSKDGRRLRFTLHDPKSNATTIWEVLSDGTNLHPLLPDGSFPGAERSGQWSSDGRYFFFDSRRDGVQSVWAIREAGRSWLASNPKPVQLTFAPHGYAGVITDGDNSRIFVWGGGETIDAVRYDAKSGHLEQLLPGVTSSKVGLSSDGQWLAFVSEGSLWRSKADHSERKSLVDGLPLMSRPQWSPDGKWILFASVSGNELASHFVVSAEGGTPKQLPLGSGLIDASWHPDGQSIYFGKWPNEGNTPLRDSGVFVLDLKSSKLTKVPGSEGLVHPSYSPDGRFVGAVTSFELNPNEPTRLKLFDTRTQTWKEIGQGALVGTVQWSRDSKYVYYQDILGQDEPIFRFAIASGKTDRFLDFSSLLRAGYTRCGFDRFESDGRLMMTLSRSDSDVFRLDLDLP